LRSDGIISGASGFEPHRKAIGPATPNAEVVDVGSGHQPSRSRVHIT
jgi:hypothetical protein